MQRRPETKRLALTVVLALVAAIVGGLIALWLVGGWSAVGRLGILAEARRQELGQQDLENLKRIATPVEEFAVDHRGLYPRFLDEVGAPFLPQTIYIPGSSPAKPYTYVRDPANTTFGKYVVADDGSFDPSLLKLHSGVDGSLCAPETCKYIVYIQAAGLMGLPDLSKISEPAPAPTSPIPGASVLYEPLVQASRVIPPIRP